MTLCASTDTLMKKNKDYEQAHQIHVRQMHCGKQEYTRANEDACISSESCHSHANYEELHNIALLSNYSQSL